MKINLNEAFQKQQLQDDDPFKVIYRKIHEDDFVPKEEESLNYIEIIGGDDAYKKRELKRLGLIKPWKTYIAIAIFLLLIIGLTVSGTFEKTFNLLQERQREMMVSREFGDIKIKNASNFIDIMEYNDGNSVLSISSDISGGDSAYVVFELNDKQEQYKLSNASGTIYIVNDYIVNTAKSGFKIRTYNNNIFLDYVQRKPEVFVVEISGMDKMFEVNDISVLKLYLDISFDKIDKNSVKFFIGNSAK